MAKQVLVPQGMGCRMFRNCGDERRVLADIVDQRATSLTKVLTIANELSIQFRGCTGKIARRARVGHNGRIRSGPAELAAGF